MLQRTGLPGQQRRIAAGREGKESVGRGRVDTGQTERQVLSKTPILPPEWPYLTYVMAGAETRTIHLSVWFVCLTITGSSFPPLWPLTTPAAEHFHPVQWSGKHRRHTLECAEPGSPLCFLIGRSPRFLPVLAFSSCYLSYHFPLTRTLQTRARPRHSTASRRYD